MTKKKLLQNDIIFIVSFLFGLSVLLLYIDSYIIWQDEGFYPTIALRLINGDTLIADEWHLSQFSSLFLYLPIRIWLHIKGSTEGLILFMRYLFLLLQSCGCIAIYLRFRSKGFWAISAAFLFLSQSPMSISSINYNSLCAFFLLLICLLMSFLQQKGHPALYFSIGILYGCLCICNPFAFILFFIYCGYIIMYHYYNSAAYKKNLKKKNKIRKKKGKEPKQKPTILTLAPDFFTIKAFLPFFIGAFCMFIILVGFFFMNGGSFAAFTDNFKYLLTDSEHDIFNSPLVAFFEKIKKTASLFSNLHMNFPYVVFALAAALLFDKKRTANNHRIVYLFISFAITIFCAIGVLLAAYTDQSTSLFWSYPLLLQSTVCYVLTKNKNKNLFYFFWVPVLLTSIMQYFASNLIFTSLGWVLAINNVAGVFFIKDFLTEIKNDQKSLQKGLYSAALIILSVFISLQSAYNFLPVAISSDPADKELRLIETGPMKGLHISSRYYGTLILNMQDMDTIKKQSSANDPVLILSKMYWLYLYIDRPFAVYSAWQNLFEPERLQAYYKQNPDKTPKYIYISAVDPFNGYAVSFKKALQTVDIMQGLFDCSVEKLSRGYLLTVDD